MSWTNGLRLSCCTIASLARAIQIGWLMSQDWITLCNPACWQKLSANGLIDLMPLPKIANNNATNRGA
jgi:hypothetical protein